MRSPTPSPRCPLPRSSAGGKDPSAALHVIARQLRVIRLLLDQCLGMTNDVIVAHTTPSSLVRTNNQRTRYRSSGKSSFEAAMEGGTHTQQIELLRRRCLRISVSSRISRCAAMPKARRVDGIFDTRAKCPKRALLMHDSAGKILASVLTSVRPTTFVQEYCATSQESYT